MKNSIPSLLISLLAISGATYAESIKSIETIPLQHVRLLPGPFQNAQNTNISYLLALDADRLLAPYRLQAGLESPATSYGNWEEDGLDGHIGGHYLSALGMMYASTGNEEIGRRLDYVLTTHEEVQAANGNGYIGGVPDSEELWDEIRGGQIDADLFVLNDKWVPWYNIDKVFSGLRDVYNDTGDERALQMLIGLGEWALDLVSNLSDEQIQDMLISEHGAINAAFADLYEFTSDERYLQLAKQFSHEQILQPLAQQQDQLNGLHANTQIPKIIGFERVYDVSGEQAYGEASEYFWDNVTGNRTVAIGGNSVREHFHPADDFSTMIDDVEGPETCNSYNMMKLSKLLYQRTGDTKYLQYYERTLYNHILSSQHPDHGGLVYFTPMRPNHYRVYSSVEDSMWCCVGSGIENHSKYGRMIYAQDADSLYVNLFVPSQLSWDEAGIDLTMETAFPDDENVTLTFHKDINKSLKIRYPTWVEENALTLTVNGEPVNFEAQPGEYIEIEREWQADDQVSWQLPMEMALEQLPDGSDYYAVLYGPIVLAAKAEPSFSDELNFIADSSRMGHIASGPQCPLESAPMFIAESLTFLDKIKPVAGLPLTFRVEDDDLIQPSPSEPTYLIPFFRVHDARYTVYWPYSSPDNMDQFRETQLTRSLDMQRLQHITVDSVVPGEQQPEADHYFRGENTQAGVNNGHHWRDATGWFSYQLNNSEGNARVLQLTYWGADAGREFDVSINGILLASVELEGEHGPVLYHRQYALPKKLHDAPVLTLRFDAKEGSVAGGIYGVRLLQEAAE